MSASDRLKVAISQLRQTHNGSAMIQFFNVPLSEERGPTVLSHIRSVSFVIPVDTATVKSNGSGTVVVSRADICTACGLSPATPATSVGLYLLQCNAVVTRFGGHGLASSVITMDVSHAGKSLGNAPPVMILRDSSEEKSDRLAPSFKGRILAGEELPVGLYLSNSGMPVSLKTWIPEIDNLKRLQLFSELHDLSKNRLAPSSGDGLLIRHGAEYSSKLLAFWDNEVMDWSDRNKAVANPDNQMARATAQNIVCENDSVSFKTVESAAQAKTDAFNAFKNKNASSGILWNQEEGLSFTISDSDSDLVDEDSVAPSEKTTSWMTVRVFCTFFLVE